MAGEDGRSYQIIIGPRRTHT